MQPDKTAKADQKKPQPPKQRATNALGVAVSDIPADQLRALKLRNGVQIDAVDGPAARVGLQKGDIILRVGDTDITSAKQFDELSSHLDSQKMVALLVRRGENTQFVPIRPRGVQK
jgi:serine protease Do